MPIPEQEKIFNSFVGGRFTRSNLTAISDDHVLVARNVLFPGDSRAHKRPGYTLVRAAALPNCSKIYDFRRQIDLAQFVLLAGGGLVSWMPAAGAVPTPLSAGEDLQAVWQFATNPYSLFASNGKNAYRFIDSGDGKLTKYNWAFPVPAAAPTIQVLGASTLTLAQGRQYAYSFVSKWTDSQGTQRVHVGAPSPLSAHTGPITNGAVNVAQLNAPVPADAQVTHIWVWATVDEPLNSSSILFFAAELAIGTTSWGDTLADTSLDQTRQIPYNNQPVPAAGILLEYHGRIVLAMIPGKPDLAQATGLEEVPLGIPQMTAPVSVFFNVPGGNKAITGGCVYNDAVWLGTEEFWFQVQGLTAESFEEHDRVFGPGPAGPDAVLVTPQYMIWLGKDKKLWAYAAGSEQPSEVSWKIQRADGSTQLAMENLSDAMLARAQLRFYSFGRYSLVAAFVSTTGSNYFDWVQFWDVTALHGPQSYFGAVTKDGRVMGPAESDAFFNDHMTAAGNVLVGATPYLFLADQLGNVYRWPDGYQDNGQNYLPIAGSEFSDLDEPDVRKRMLWLDLMTTRPDAALSFQARAIAQDGLMIDARPVNLGQGRPIPGPRHAQDPTSVRFRLNVRGASFGRYLRWFVVFPFDEHSAELEAVIAKFTPIGGDTK